MASIRDSLLRRLTDDPARRALSFFEIRGGQGVWSNFTWLTLAQRAVGLAREVDIANPHSRTPPVVALLLPSGPDFWAGFLGCAIAGAISVPLFPPEGSSPSLRERLTAVLLNCRPDVVLTLAADRQSTIETLQAIRLSPHVIAADEVPTVHATAVELCDDISRWERASGDVAYLQYTSGSTSQPSGVMITHDAFEANVRQSFVALGCQASDRSVSWLPLFHDMGLILTLGAAIGFGCSCTLMSTSTFLRQPERWLRELGRGDVTFSSAPNFAFEHCTRLLGKRRADLSGLDLSNVRFILNGAEPVHPSTIREFEQAFGGEHGLIPGTVKPAFGLAEATVYVSSAESLRVMSVSRSGLGRHLVERPVDDGDRLEVVSCGRAGGDIKAMCVDPKTHKILDEGVVGELWLSGPNIASGYWGDEVKSAERFNLVPEPQTGDGWMATGDLAYLMDDEIYVVGRLKAMIIADGQNHYGEDVERTVQTVDRRIRPGRVMVVASPVGVSESALIVAECRGLDAIDCEALKQSIVERVNHVHGLRVASVQLLTPGSIPLTSSGKVQRGGAAQLVESQSGTK